MKIFFRFWDNCLITILISKLSFIFSPIFLPNTPGKLKNQKMVSIVSRTGRQFQRYNQGCRQVVGWVSTFSLFFLSFCFWGIFFFFFLFSFLGNCGFDLDWEICIRDGFLLNGLIFFILKSLFSWVIFGDFDGIFFFHLWRNFPLESGGE